MQVNNMEAVKRAVMDIMEERMKIVLAEMEAQIKSDADFPVDTTNLKARQHTDLNRQSNVINGRLINDADYAIYVHEGTGIYASNGRGRKTPWFVKDVKYKGKTMSFWTRGIKAHKFISKHTLAQTGLNLIHSIFKGEVR